MVEKGDAVKKGQVIGQSVGFVSVPVHSPVSGTVKEVRVEKGKTVEKGALLILLE